MNSRKTLYIVGSLVIGVCSVLIILFGILLFASFDESNNELVFVSDSREFIYDGTEHTSSGWRLSEGKLRSGHRATVNVYGSQKEVGTSENIFSVIIVDGRDNDVTETYTVTLKAGELVVKPRPLVVTTASTEKYYDGFPLRDNNWAITFGSVLYGNSLSVYVTGERTEKGVSANTATVSIEDWYGNDVSGNYALEIKEGELRVLGLYVAISTSSATKVYDGDPLALAEWKLNSTLRAGDYIDSVVMPATITERGTVENYISEIIIKNADGEIVDYYDVEVTAGTLAVTPRIITVRSDDAAKDYDGTPLTADGWELVSVTRPVDGHLLEVSVSGTRTEPGESPNVIAQAVIYDASGKNVTSNYDVVYQAGTLVVRGEVEIPGDPSSSGSNGTGSGTGGSSLDVSGSISGGSTQPSAALKLYSDRSGEAYLRLKSFGGYSGGSWQDAAAYGELLYGKYSANYLSGISLARAGFDRTHVRIQSHSADYLLPAYADYSDGDYVIQTNDIVNVGDTSVIYSLNCYLYDYIANGAIGVDLGDCSSFERDYYSFVRGNYLAVPSSTFDYLNSLISENGWSVSDPLVIEKIAAFVQNSANYNLNYNVRLDDEEDIVVAFLRDYKEGICQHYASAATLLFRALGIPARYTVGYKARTLADNWVLVSSENAHAWVEVYIQGFGWATVEVTGASRTTGDKLVLEIKPVDIAEKYNGTVLTHNGEVQGLSELLAQGYTYTAEISGRQSTVGISESRITSFILYNPSGKDVTDEYNIVATAGRLQLYINEITVVTGSASKQYDGSALTYGFVYYSGELIAGHSVKTLETTGSLITVGKSVNLFNIVIADENGADVTYMYKINAEYGVLEVQPRKITIVADSSEKTYDGTPLTNSNFYVGVEWGRITDKVTAVVNGTQTSIGYSDNVITSYKITDKNGNDVTSNYSVTLVNGTLRVLP